MLWAQHADASAHYERPEQSEVICLSLTTNDYQLQKPLRVDVVTADRDTKPTVALTDQAAALSPDHLRQKDFVFQQEIAQDEV